MVPVSMGLVRVRVRVGVGKASACAAGFIRFSVWKTQRQRTERLFHLSLHSHQIASCCLQANGRGTVGHGPGAVCKRPFPDVCDRLSRHFLFLLSFSFGFLSFPFLLLLLPSPFFTPPLFFFCWFFIEVSPFSFLPFLFFPRFGRATRVIAHTLSPPFFPLLRQPVTAQMQLTSSSTCVLPCPRWQCLTSNLGTIKKKKRRKKKTVARHSFFSQE